MGVVSVFRNIHHQNLYETMKLRLPVFLLMKRSTKTTTKRNIKQHMQVSIIPFLKTTNLQQRENQNKIFTTQS